MTAEHQQIVYDVVARLGQSSQEGKRGKAVDDFIPLENEATSKATTATPRSPETYKRKRVSIDSSVRDRVELPWKASIREVQGPALRLHFEIMELEELLKPTAAETLIRTEAVERVTEAIQCIFPTAQVGLFGSFATGLYLPTSDLDLVVTRSGCPNKQNALRALRRILVDREMATNIQQTAGAMYLGSHDPGFLEMISRLFSKDLLTDTMHLLQLISRARVPIVKFEDVESGLAFDVSFDLDGGPKAAKYVVQLLDELHQMRPLVMILKLFLQQRGLNEVYQGGIGSYALLVMVAAFLKTHWTRFRPRPGCDIPKMEDNLGELLIDFFRLYARDLNMERVGVSCSGAGSFFPKEAWGFLQEERPYLLAVQDPKDPSNDIAKGSFLLRKVRKAFDVAYQSLTTPVHREDSLLHRVLRLDTILMIRTSLRGGLTFKKAARETELIEEEMTVGSRSRRRSRQDEKLEKVGTAGRKIQKSHKSHKSHKAARFFSKGHRSSEEPSERSRKQKGTSSRRKRRSSREAVWG